MKTSGGNNNTSDNELLWIMGGLFAISIAAWVFGHEKIATFVMKVRQFELHLMVFDQEGRAMLAAWLQARHPADATAGELWRSGAVAAQTLRWGVFAVITLMFAYLAYRSPDRNGRYSRTYTVSTLAKQEAELWPVLKPVLDVNLIDVPLDDPVNGMRQLPRDYARRLGILVNLATLGADEDVSNVEPLDDRSALRLDRARKVFATQLGQQWPGVQGIRGFERALFAAFCAQIHNDNTLALAIINDLAISYLRARRQKDAKLINSIRAQKALYQYGNSEAVKRIVNSHAYTRTVLRSMLQAARDCGVLPSAWFRWVKTVDRITWYALNDLGLEVASVEAAGIRAHWDAELLAKTPIQNPLIEPAIEGLRTYLGETLDEEIEHD